MNTNLWYLINTNPSAITNNLAETKKDFILKEFDNLISILENKKANFYVKEDSEVIEFLQQKINLISEIKKRVIR